MLLVPEGWFEMGSNDAEDDEKPVHRVWLDTFYMDKYEVTVGEYTAFLRPTGRQGLPDYVATYAPGGQYPVVGVRLGRCRGVLSLGRKTVAHRGAVGEGRARHR